MIEDPSFVKYNNLISISLMVYQHQYPVYALLISLYFITYFPTVILLFGEKTFTKANVSFEINE